MELFKWSENLSVGIDTIDRQHQKLVSLVNELHAAMSKGKGKDVLGYILEELINYTQYHFAHEEKLFDRYGFPGASAHRKEHEQLVEEVKKLHEKFTKGNLMLSMEVLYFLKNWVTNHIEKTDKQYGPYFREKGVH